MPRRTSLGGRQWVTCNRYPHFQVLYYLASVSSLEVNFSFEEVDKKPGSDLTVRGASVPPMFVGTCTLKDPINSRFFVPFTLWNISTNLAQSVVLPFWKYAIIFCNILADCGKYRPIAQKRTLLGGRGRSSFRSTSRVLAAVVIDERGTSWFVFIDWL